MNDGKKKKPQKHKNKTAFKITFDTQVLEHQKKISLKDLCVRCTQQIQWKIQFNKYKKMTEPARCNICQQKNVYRTYMKACQICLQQKKICAKCLAPDYEYPKNVKISEKDQKQQQKAECNQQVDFMKKLQERSRRTIRRNLQKGKFFWDSNQDYFVNEEGKKIVGLHFKKEFEEENQNSINDNNLMDESEEDSLDGDYDDESLNQKKFKKTQILQEKKQSYDMSIQQQENSSKGSGEEIYCQKYLELNEQNVEDSFDSNNGKLQDQLTKIFQNQERLKSESNK